MGSGTVIPKRKSEAEKEENKDKVCKLHGNVQEVSFIKRW